MYGGARDTTAWILFSSRGSRVQIPSSPPHSPRLGAAHSQTIARPCLRFMRGVAFWRLTLLERNDSGPRYREESFRFDFGDNLRGVESVRGDEALTG